MALQSITALNELLLRVTSITHHSVNKGLLAKAQQIEEQEENMLSESEE